MAGLTICREQDKRGGGKEEEAEGEGEGEGERRELPKQCVDHSEKGGQRRREGRKALPYTCHFCANNRRIELSVHAVQLGSASVPKRLRCRLLEGQFVYRVASSIRRRGGKKKKKNRGIIIIIIRPLSIVGDCAPRSSSSSSLSCSLP